MSEILIAHLPIEGCGCPACAGNTEEASLDGSAGGTANNKPIWSIDQVYANLNRTSGQWGGGFNDLMPRGGDASVITFGFHENQQSLADNGYVYTLNGVQYYAFSEYFNFASFSEAQRAATREAMQNWDDVVAVSFVETSAYEGDINFANLASAPNTQAYSRIPTAGYGTNFGGAYGTELSIAGYAADIWVSASQASNFQFDEGMYGLNTLVHEIGHSLGLSHPGAYNFGTTPRAITYVLDAEYAQDARNYSIMSYFNPRDMGPAVVTRDFDWSIMQIAYGSTPMIHDIYAAQMMYGVDTTTRTGDTTYGFNSNAGRDHYDFTKTPWPTMTIWDAGGNDTLDASGFNANQVIDLTPGSLSSIGGLTYAEAMAQLTYNQVNANRAAVGLGPVSQTTYNNNMAVLAVQNDRARLTDNVGIAYGVTIENAKGGGGNDTIIGNDANNVLEGNAGNDWIEGRNGNDRLIGGDGNDHLVGGDGTDFLTGGAGADTFHAEINSNTVGSKLGQVSLDVYTDFVSGTDKIDLRAIDALSGMSGHQSFKFGGTMNNKTAGMLTYKVYDSVNGAENALGMDIDGIDGPSTYTGPVTVLFGNVDGGAPDFAIALLNTNGVNYSDLIF